MTIPHPYLLAIGIALFLLGIWFWRWSSRNAIDLKGAAIGAAFQGAVRRQIPDIPDDIKSKISQVTSEQSNIKRAQKAGTLAARHAVAQVVWITSLVCLVAGATLTVAGFYWR